MNSISVSVSVFCLFFIYVLYSDNVMVLLTFAMFITGFQFKVVQHFAVFG